MDGRKLDVSVGDKVISGVCGGLAEYFGISSFVVRLIFIFTPGSLAVYIILALYFNRDYIF
ncbi:PspC domain-containing protein [Amphibacillus cookii]|uniref:PspC domain-containing protein n=1 Tax=Amphibacillus cookii TaxID=767787 RepID=UPI00195AE2F8|nr:PspC domain-containing protein [Amphibacillus cookii]MBM7543268.1 phage shock protein PspC (stress-responsive transcriptional regulator) [Amphibacillus cookii]